MCVHCWTAWHRWLTLRAKRSINATTWKITLPQMSSLKLFGQLIRTFSSCNHICKDHYLWSLRIRPNPPDPRGVRQSTQLSTAEDKEHEMNTAIAKSPTQLVKLKSRQEGAERTMAFHFEKPASFKFIPGQFIDMTLLTPSETDGEGNTRGFSIASAPY